MDFLSTSPAQVERHAALGFATRLLLGTTRNKFRLASLEPQLWPAVTLNQILFYFDGRGNPRAYVTWAYVTDAVLKDVSSDENRLLHLSEWNEGENLLIVDFVAPFGHAGRFARHLYRSVFREHDVGHGVRNSADGRISKICNLRKPRRYKATSSVSSKVLASS